MRGRSGSRLVAVGMSALAVLTLAACAPSSVETTQAYSGAKLPRPDVILVNDFAVTSDGVALDRGIAARAERVLEGGSSAEEQRKTGRAVASAVSDTLVAELRAAGLPAERIAGSSWVRVVDNRAKVNSTGVIIDGELLSIDQGNRTRRNLIGLGAGQSRVASDTTVVYNSADGSMRSLLSFRADAESSRKPGAVETMGVGAATGRLASSAAVTAGTSAGGSAISDNLNPTVEADARRMARAIADKIEDFGVAQGWIATKPAGMR